MFELMSMIRVMIRQKTQHLVLMFQVAFTLAIIANALFIVQQRLALMERPTGIDEDHIVTVSQYYFGDLTDVGEQYQQDLRTLLAIDGVEAASLINNIPIEDSSNNSTFADSEKDGHHIESGIYISDEKLLPTLGVKLIAGRNFDATDIGRDYNNGESVNMLVTKAFVEQMFPDLTHVEQALGKPVYSFGITLIIVGVIEKLHGGALGKDHLEVNVVFPEHTANQFQNIMLNVSTNNIAELRQKVTQALLADNPNRVIRSVRPFSEIRQDAYAADQMMVTLLTSLIAILVFITALGMFGSTSFQVNRRTKQIGTRRALGATKSDILAYFIGENLLLTAIGASVGFLLAIALNQLLMQQYEMSQLPISYLLVSLFALALLGMLAVLYPALKAANVSPALATRSV